jgi:hypothetical protein
MEGSNKAVIQFIELCKRKSTVKPVRALFKDRFQWARLMWRWAVNLYQK